MAAAEMLFLFVAVLVVDDVVVTVFVAFDVVPVAVFVVVFDLGFVDVFAAVCFVVVCCCLCCCFLLL